MPDSPSPFDDPFADLFGKLPDPRAHGTRTVPAESAEAERAATPSDPPAVPGSRRAAREAAAAVTGSVPLQGPPAISGPISAPAAPTGAAPASTAAPARAATPAAAVAQAQTRVDTPTTALPVQAQDDDWPFSGSGSTASSAAAGAQPALPYSRTGGNRVVTPAMTADAASGSHASLDDLFSGHGSGGGGSSSARPPKRRRRIGGWIALGVVLLLLGGVAAGGLWVWNTYEAKIREFMGWEEPKDYADGEATGEALVTISSGDTGSVISTSLYKAGVTKTSAAFYDMLVSTGQNPTFYPGVYKLQKKMTSAAALTALQDPATKMENSALLREGLTLKQTLPILAEGIGIPLADFEAAVADPSVYGVSAQSLEGWLFPAMYTFDPGATAQDVIQAMVNRTVQSLDKAGVPADDRQRVLTVASIIQREAGYQQDFYKVSRVIENRLDPSNTETYGLLQMDSTAKYGVGEDDSGSLDVSKNAQTNDNPWNTYLHPGLPIGPISNPGDVAIDAAMHPADGPWLYFVTVDPSSGETVFTDTYAEHLKYVQQWRDWCTAHPDYPCT